MAHEDAQPRMLQGMRQQLQFDRNGHIYPVQKAGLLQEANAYRQAAYVLWELLSSSSLGVWKDRRMKQMSEYFHNYADYLQSDHWFQVRNEAVKRDGYCCTRCPSRHYLQAHHVVYPSRWIDTTIEHLITLCRSCHELEHGIVPAVRSKSRKSRTPSKNRTVHLKPFSVGMYEGITPDQARLQVGLSVRQSPHHPNELKERDAMEVFEDLRNAYLQLTGNDLSKLSARLVRKLQRAQAKAHQFLKNTAPVLDYQPAR